MAKRKKKQEDSGVEIIENPDVLAHKAEEFFSNKRNKNLVFGIGGAIALIIAVFVIYRYYITNQNLEAQEEMFQAIYYFEGDSLGRALNGDGNNYGFLDIIDYYGGTDAANLSQFYAGSIYIKLGDFESAIRYLNEFSSSDILLQARAYSLIGDAYMELDDFENASEYFKMASDYKPNKEFTPLYLKKLAIAQEQQGDLDGAAKSYSRIVDDFYESNLRQEALKQRARLEGLMVE